MKRTAIMIKIQSGTVIICGTITCKCTGEMSDGSKVWTDIETEEQYQLFRVSGKYVFCHM